MVHPALSISTAPQASGNAGDKALAKTKRLSGLTSGNPVKRLLATTGIAVLLCLIVSCFLGAPSTPRLLLNKYAPVRLQDSFAKRGTAQFFHQKELQLAREVPGIRFWDSLGPGEAGIFISTPFQAPRLLSLYISGYPLSAGISIELEDVETKQTFKLGSPNSYSSWTQVSWSLPSSLELRRVRLKVVDTDTSPNRWIGVSSPLEVTSGTPWLLDRHLMLLLPSVMVQFLLLFLPGLLILVRSGCATKFPTWFRLPAAILISCVLAYAVFWLTFFDPDLGITAVLAGAGICFFVLLESLRLPRFRTLLLSQHIVLPALLQFVVTCLYIAVGFLAPLGDVPDVNLQHRFLVLPGDNLIPRYFAEKLFLGQDPRPIMGDWLSSDRPPLLTALLLLVRPFIGFGDERMLQLQYLIGATLAQTTWVAALYALLSCLKTSSYHQKLIFFCCLCSGTFLLHSIYVWPKFLAGSLGIFSLTLVLQLYTQKKARSLLRAGAAGLGLILAFLAHGGVIFIYPPILALLLFPRSYPGWRKLAVAAAIMLALYLPWMMYQKVYEPPADRLVKWHLAGMIDINDLSVGEAVRQAYSQHSLSTLAGYKLSNLWWMFGPPFLTDATARRTNEFYFSVSALGVLNIGFLLFCARIFLSSRNKDSRTHSRLKLCFWMLFWGSLSWAIILFGPQGNVIHVGSFIHFILLYAVAALGLAWLPLWVGIGLAAIHCGLFLQAWVHPSYVVQSGSLAPLVQPLPLLICIILLASLGLAALATNTKNS